jgi:hypothetical protein
LVAEAIAQSADRDNVELLPPRLSGRTLSLGGTVPLICPSADLVLPVRVSTLDRSLELVVVPFDHHEIVIGKRTPLFLKLTFELVPFTFEMIGVHGAPPFDD